MSEEITKGGDIRSTGSHELSSDISTITAEINAYQRIAGEAIFEIGRRLKHVKETLMEEKHGEWTKWLADIGMTRMHASRFIRVYERFHNVKHIKLPNHISILYELADLTDEQLTSEYRLPSGEKKKPIDMSRREIEEIKRRNVRNSQKKVRREMVLDNRSECYICRNDCRPILQLHHLKPVKNDGDNSDDNVLLLCPNCHSIIHLFLADSVEKHFGLDYIVDWINKRFETEAIDRIRKVWERMVS